MAGLGDDIDPAMMAALMATTALVAKGASNEEVRELEKHFALKFLFVIQVTNKRAKMIFFYTLKRRRKFFLKENF